MTEWQTVRLGDMVNFNPRECLVKGAVAKKVAMKRLDPFSRRIVDYERAPFNGGSKFKNGDTIMARITPCLDNGKTAQVNILEHDEIGFGSSEFIVLRNIEGISDKDFVYYLAISPNIRDSAIKSMVGSSGRQRVAQDVLENMLVYFPPLLTQRAVAATLSPLDDKIELNRRINANLEAQAQALFKNWFVDFEPFKNGGFVESELGRIPKGWRVGKLTDIADYLNGLAMQKYRPSKAESGIPVLKIRELRQGICDLSTELCSENVDDLYIVNDGDVIFSWSGSLLVDLWCGGKCGLNQHLFKVTSKKYDKWYYLLWTKYHLNNFISIAADKATTMGHIKREHLEKALVLIPDNTSYSKISSIMQPILSAISINRVQSRTLAAIRDALLPKLMSGEIEVKEEIP